MFTTVPYLQKMGTIWKQCSALKWGMFFQCFSNVKNQNPTTAHTLVVGV